MRRELAEFYALLMPNPPKLPGFAVHDILRVMHEDGWVIQTSMASLLTGQNTTDNLLPTLKMPVLLVWGAEDKIIPLAQGQTMVKIIPHAELDVFSGCGHLAPAQCANEIAPKVLEFVNRLAFNFDGIDSEFLVRFGADSSRSVRIWKWS